MGRQQSTLKLLQPASLTATALLKVLAS